MGVGKLAQVQEAVARHMDDIADYFKPGVKITVIVRSPGFPERDFVMTTDTLGLAITALRRRENAGGTTLADAIEGAPV